MQGLYVHCGEPLKKLNHGTLFDLICPETKVFDVNLLSAVLQSVGSCI